MRLSPEKIVRLPTLAETKAAIAYFETLDLASISYDRLLQETFERFPYMPAHQGTFTSNLYFFRARLNVGTERFHSILDIGPPPASVLRGFGRANKPGQQMFYASYLPDLALHEVCQALPSRRLSLPGCATIGVWKPIPSESLRLVNIYQSKELQARRPELHRAMTAYYEALRPTGGFAFNLPDADAQAVCALVDAHVARVFARANVHDDSGYKLSAAYTERFIDDNSADYLDGINYPSVAGGYEADNVVLRFSTYTDRLYPVTAYLVSYVYNAGDRSISVGRQILRAELVGEQLVWP